MSTCAACGTTLAPDKPGEKCPQCGAAFVGNDSLSQPNASSPEASVAGRAITFAPPRFGVTPILVGINVLVFLAMVASGVSFVNPSVGAMKLWGADYGPLTFGSHQMWRLLTSNYLHFGIVHLLLNMWCLWGLGRLTEVFYSTTDYLILYTLTGISGSMLSVTLKPLGVGAGASGAIFGLAGVMLTTLKWGNLPLPPENRSQIYKGVWQFAGINLVFGALAPGVDNVGHLGGFFYGLLIGAVMGKHLEDSVASRAYRRKAWLWLILIIGMGLLVLSHTIWIIPVSVRHR